MKTKSNLEKDEALGIPHGTACSRLRKMLLFKFAAALGLRNCYRCGIDIEDIDQFSIEHKLAWMRQADPKEAFFDLDNIAFSHINCNVKAAEHVKLYETPAERHRAGLNRWYQKNRLKIRAHRKEKRNAEEWS